MRSGVSALKGVMCLLGVVALTGAKTNGCGPDFEDGGQPPVDCPEGFVFDGQACVPDEVPACPPDSTEQWVCATPEPAVDGMDSPPDLPPEQCWLECVPVDPPICPEGTVEQTVCSGGGGDEDPVPPYDPDQGEGYNPDDPSTPPVPPGECRTECVPVDPGCPPNFHEELICPPGCEEEECYVTCVPNDACPPGSHVETTCYYGDEEGNVSVYCVDECIPDEPPPPPCPEGTHPEIRCYEDMNGGGCIEECVPDYPYPCPPETLPVTTCYPDGTCVQECIPDDPNQCPPGMYLEMICDMNGCFEVCQYIEPDVDEPGDPGQPRQP